MLHFIENGTDKVTPSVSDSQRIANVEEKTESGLEQQTLAEKPKISPSVTGAKGNLFVNDYCKKYCIATTYLMLNLNKC